MPAILVKPDPVMVAGTSAEVLMTLPYERTRAVVQTHEFLVELSRNTDLAEAIRLEAKRLLRHFPSKADVLLAGKIEEKAGGSIIEPVFSSSTER